jgi:hypothetical protein
MVPSITALAEEVTADMILDRLIEAVPVPRVAHDGLIQRAEAAERVALIGGRRTFESVDAAEREDREATA